MMLIVVEMHLIFHVIANLEMQIVFEIAWQIGARKYSHIAVKSSLEYFLSNDTTLVSGNEEPRFSNCARAGNSLCHRFPPEYKHLS